MIDQCKNWLLKEALPCWMPEGQDPLTGSFMEALSFPQAKAIVDLPRRSMVQCRQLYVLNQTIKLGLTDKDTKKSK